MSIAMTIFSLLGTFIIGFSMFPQTIATVKNRDTANLSLALYFVMGIATALITIYGIGLVIIPNPETLTGAAQEALANKINDGGFAYTGEAIVSNASWMGAVKTNWILSFVVPGAAIIFGELICSITSFIVAFLKISNMRHAKKLGISEAEYVARVTGKNKPEAKKAKSFDEDEDEEEYEERKTKTTKSTSSSKSASSKKSTSSSKSSNIPSNQKHTVVDHEYFENNYNYDRRRKEWHQKAGHNKTQLVCDFCKDDDNWESILLDNGKNVCYYCWIKKPTNLKSSKVKSRK